MNVFWLIERGPNQGDPHHWWWSRAAANVSTGAPPGDWVRDVADATPFPTQKEATQAMLDDGVTHCVVTSHSYLDVVESPGTPTELPALEFLRRLAGSKDMCIVSSGRMSAMEISHTQADRRFLTLADGLGFALVPIIRGS